ncbi:MAG: NAD(P)/FAD-dependent oxidoreductase [Anaerolineae bacterium]
MKHVIIGASAAGISAAETLRQEDPTCEITMISDEPNPLYSRPLISYLLAGELPEERLAYRPSDFFEQNRIEALLGHRAVRVEPEADRVMLDTGEKLEYDNLLIATGASPKLPGIEGGDQPGVLGFRTLEDAKTILRALPELNQALVLGGGLVGLKVAVGLKARGMDVTVAVGSPHLLSQMVDAGAAAIYRELLEEHGINVATGMRAAVILGDGWVEGVRMESGEEFPAQLVVAGKGVYANMDLVKGTQVRCDYGILIDEHCRTNVKNIYAAGDVAQSYDLVRDEYWTNQIWPCAVEQGRIAVLNMAGREAIYQGSMGMNSIQFFDLPVISAGLAGLREKDFDEELIERPSPQVYKRFVFRGNRVVGFVLVGDIKSAGIIRSLVANGANVKEVKGQLLKDTLNFSEIMPLIEDQSERFTEQEYRELIETMKFVG